MIQGLHPRYRWHRLRDCGKTGFEPFDGHFRVRYSDGEHSIRMRYQTARDYAELFDGCVEWVR